MPVNNKAVPNNGIQKRITDFAVRKINEADRIVSVSFSSETPVSRFFGVEYLSHDLNSIDLSRINEIGVSLWNHDRNVVLGKIQNARLDEKERKTYCDIVFDEDEQANLIYEKVRKGTLKGVSVGYSVDTWEEVATGKTSSNGRFTGPCYVATRWAPLEISIVSVPADDSVGVGREIENIEGNNRSDKEEDTNMANGLSQNRTTGMASFTTNPQVEQSNTENQRNQENSTQQVDTQRVIQEERKRVAEITALCRGMSITQEDQDKFISDGISIDEVRKAVLEQQMQRNRPVAASDNTDVRITAAEEDKFRSAASDAILLRAGVQLRRPSDGSQDLRAVRLRDLAIECLDRIGIKNAYRMTDDELLRRNLSPDSQFSSILNTSVNASVRNGYEVAPQTFRDWVGFDSNPDFKAKPIYRLSEAGEPELITQGGEFKFDEMQDESITTKLETRGRGFAFTREAMINDDLNVLVKVPMAYTIAYIGKINKLVYGLLGNANTQYKGANLFSSDRGNLASTGAKISTTSLSTMKASMRRQKNQRAKQTLNVVPKYLIVPPEQETLANSYLISPADPEGDNASVLNTFRNSMEVICDAELTDTKAWYGAANPLIIDTIIVSYLNGQEMPTLESQIAFDVLGIKYRLYGDACATVGDYRGLYKNPGA